LKYKQNCGFGEREMQVAEMMFLEYACCHSVPNLLPSCLISRNIEVRIYKPVILPIVLYGPRMLEGNNSMTEEG
jgi:hypothetical protein